MVPTHVCDQTAKHIDPAKGPGQRQQIICELHHSVDLQGEICIFRARMSLGGLSIGTRSCFRRVLGRTFMRGRIVCLCRLYTTYLTHTWRPRCNEIGRGINGEPILFCTRVGFNRLRHIHVYVACRLCSLASSGKRAREIAVARRPPSGSAGRGWSILRRHVVPYLTSWLPA